LKDFQVSLDFAIAVAAKLLQATLEAALLDEEEMHARAHVRWIVRDHDLGSDIGMAAEQELLMRLDAMLDQDTTVEHWRSEKWGFPVGSFPTIPVRHARKIEDAACRSSVQQTQKTDRTIHKHDAKPQPSARNH